MQLFAKFKKILYMRFRVTLNFENYIVFSSPAPVKLLSSHLPAQQLGTSPCVARSSRMT